MNKPLVITLVIAVIAAVGFYLQWNLAKEAETTSVEIAKVTKSQIIQKVNTTGKIQPKTQINISAARA